MDQDIAVKFAEQDKKLEAIYRSTEKTRKIFTWTIWITIIMFVLPLIGLAFVIPFYLSQISLSGLGF